MMPVDLLEVELLSDLVRRVTKKDRNSIKHLKKIEARLVTKCGSRPRERTIDQLNDYKVQLALTK
jgi:hypothetical protein